MSVAFILLSIFNPYNSTPGASTTAAAASVSASENKVITAGLSGSDNYDLVVGHSHHVEEAMTDQYDAAQLIKVREGTQTSFTKSPAEIIDEYYHKDDYLHYGGNGEPVKPMCKIDDEDSVALEALPNGVLNVNQPSAPVSCTTEQGVKLYVTAWAK